MNPNLPLSHLLQQMLAEQEYSQIVHYDKDEIVSSLHGEDRELLALMMALHGEKILKEDGEKGRYYLAKSTEIAPESETVHLHKARAFAHPSHAPSDLLIAMESYMKAVELNPSRIQTWIQGGSLLVHLGKLTQDMDYLYQADGWLTQAEKLSIETKKSLKSSFYWIWGQLWHSISRLSGEAADLSRTVEKYKKTAEQDIKQVQFWNDYANALWELGGLLKNNEVFEEVVSYYQRAIELDPRYYPAQFNLGLCFQRYFDATWKSSLFWLAHEQFQKCSVINNQHAPLYVSWGHLLLVKAKLSCDVDLLEQACDQLENANKLDPENESVHLDLAEAYLWMGRHSEDLKVLKDAETKAAAIINANPLSAEGWTLIGHCKAELGHYFEDLKLWREAQEKYNYALSINRSHVDAWYGQALVALSLGQWNDDGEQLMVAHNCMVQATEFDGPFTPQFWNDWGIINVKLAEFHENRAYLEQAVEKFEMAIELDLSINESEHVHPEWLFNYGCACDFLGDMTGDAAFYERSIALLETVLEHDPNYDEAEYSVAMAYSHLGEITSDLEPFYKACDYFRKVVSKDPEDEQAWNEWGSVLLNLAALEEDDAHPDRASQYYNEAEEKFYQAVTLGCAGAYYNLACLYSLTEDFAASIEYLDKSDRNNSLPSIDDMMHDEWLEKVRHTDEFRHLLTVILRKDIEQ